MEVIANLCFRSPSACIPGGSSDEVSEEEHDGTPEDALITKLIDAVFPAAESAAKSFLAHEAVPSMHLFLLRLLLQYE